jgi:hypothetical protein
MKAGPLRQGIAVLGLIALVPTLFNVAMGRLSPGGAAVRALITFAVVMLVGRLLAAALRFYARSVERANERRVELRRADDHAA